MKVTSAPRAAWARSRAISFSASCCRVRCPFIFTGLQIGVGVAWFSLVAAEMVSGEYGLGFLIWDSYVLSQFPVIVIAMVTLGVIGYLFSALIRAVGRQLMRWTVQDGA